MTPKCAWCDAPITDHENRLGSLCADCHTESCNQPDADDEEYRRGREIDNRIDAARGK
jgi:hypothetical protein